MSLHPLPPGARPWTGVCDWRRFPAGAQSAPVAACGFVADFLRIADEELCQVDPATCEACLRCLQHPPQVNSVVASLIHRAAGQIIAADGTRDCSVEQATAIRDRIQHQLSYVPAGAPNQVFPPPLPAVSNSTCPGGAPPGGTRTVAWMVGMLTAPRDEPTLERALCSFADAGFDRIHLYAEPGVTPPRHRVVASVTERAARLGNLGNFLFALSDLLLRGGDAECYALIQDDVIAARGLRSWVEEQLWPFSNGLLSLFTPRIHGSAAVGWQLRFPGFHRVHGGQAFVFRRDVLLRFLGDPHVLAQLQVRRHGDDALVSGWATAHGIGIAYHTPSPTQHIGARSTIYPGGPDPLNTANFVGDTRAFRRWRAPRPRLPRIGLVGCDADTGIGTVCRTLAKLLDVATWLILPCPYAHTRLAHPVGKNWQRIGPAVSPRELRTRLRGLEWLVFAERPLVPGLTGTARELGLRVACVAMWEWLNPEERWLAHVDLMICPTRHTRLHLEDWKRRFGFSFDLIDVPWPVPVKSFGYRCRRRLEQVLYVNGYGGGPGIRPDGSTTDYRRKGLDLILDAAHQLPELPFHLFTLAPIRQLVPANVAIHAAPRQPGDLYQLGDVCVQPSAWEGIGLPLLECQASGMPLITTDAPPMNEYRPFRTLEVEHEEVVLLRGQPILSRRPSVTGLVAVLRDLAGSDLSDASRSARRFIETEHDWENARVTLQRCLSVDNLECLESTKQQSAS